MNEPSSFLYIVTKCGKKNKPVPMSVLLYRSSGHCILSRAPIKLEMINMLRNVSYTYYIKMTEYKVICTLELYKEVFL